MSEAGSAPILKVNGQSLERLKLVFSLSSGWPAKGYAVDTDKNRIVFFRYECPSMIPFPVSLGPDRCAEIAKDWLLEAKYGKQPDHDGDNKEGWLCFTEGWGHIQPFGYQAFVAVEPHWIMYGK